jgi:hypothetical protein
MHDADIAISLMNQVQDEIGLADSSPYIEVLREGQLRFEHVRFVLSQARNDAHNGLEIECVIFDDGSRALRFHRSAMGKPTQWSAFAPAS